MNYRKYTHKQENQLDKIMLTVCKVFGWYMLFQIIRAAIQHGTIGG